MSSALLLLLALSPHFVFSYNIDTRLPIVYNDPVSGGPDYFGYSVSLGSGRTGTSSPSLFVGAPQFGNGTGRVYRCTDLSTKDQKPSSCQVLEIFEKPGTTSLWLGASMATGGTSDFTACAPRTLKNASSPSFKGVSFMYGTCYTFPNAKGNTLHRDEDPKNLEVDVSFANGFSVNYATKQSSSTVTRVIGQPGVNSADVKYPQGDRAIRAIDQYKGDELAQFGYSVTSGKYFGDNNLRLAAGAPSWSRKGMVAIFVPFELQFNETPPIEGSVPGEYFGASLATGDFDGDGCDDLAVGAPHWGKKDFGRVYIYHGKKNGNFEQGRTLQGKAGKGQFGYTLAAADLDHDNYSDLIVGAPWEESGAVYVYYGRPDFREENPSAQILQRIVPSAFKHHGRIQRFGFSLSHPVDVNGNGYPDLAIGAYKSGHAVVLRSRPVIETKIELASYPGMLQKSTQNFTVRACITYSGTGAPESQDLSFGMTVDPRYNRAENGSLMRLDGLFFLGNRSCVNQTINLIKNKIRNVDDETVPPPILIYVKHSIKEGVDDNKIDAVLSRKSVNESTPMTIYYDMGCKGGPVCNAKLSVNASFGGVEEDGTWVVGSGDISLNVVVSNEKEPAKRTQIKIVLPSGIRIRKPIRSCEEKPMDLRQARILTCIVADPLRKGKPISLNVDLDMRKVDMSSAHGTVLIFRVTRSTTSEDPGTIEEPDTLVSLGTKNVGNVTLTGGTDKKTIDYDRIENKSMVRVRHNYQVLRSGPSPIAKAWLIIDVPGVVGRNDSFLNVTDPKLLDGSGRIHECTIGDFRSDDHVRRNPRHISGSSDQTGQSYSGSSTIDEIPSADDQLMKNTPIGADQATERTVYLNCSTKGLPCTRVTCPFDLFKHGNDVGNMALDMTLDAEAFYTSDQDPLTIEFRTNAWLDIKSPAFSDLTYIPSAKVSTRFYNIPEPQKVSGWILPCSIILGILLFCILAFILFKAGFFNRSKKLEAAKASKDPELMLHVDDQEETDNKDTTSLHNNSQ